MHQSSLPLQQFELLARLTLLSLSLRICSFPPFSLGFPVLVLVAAQKQMLTTTKLSA